MSVELPEAQVLAEQMNKALKAKQIKSYRLQDCEKLRRLGFINKDLTIFGRLVNGKVESVTSRGNVIRVKLDNGLNLVLAPEYGGIVRYHTSNTAISGKLHLRVDFRDGTVLTVRLTGMGVIQAVRDNELEQSYVYRRDFSKTASPTDEAFTLERFSRLLAEKNVPLKSALVGKDAVVVGFGNSAFQDILYRARVHPKRKTSELGRDERQALYSAIKLVIQERIRLGGKSQFVDLHGKQGRYTPAMGPNMKQQTCPKCGTSIEKLTMGGGQTYLCPTCQK